MLINYENGILESKTVLFTGETDSGKKFSIAANWNEWDDWNVIPDDISFDENDGSDEEYSQIIEEFLYEMNS